MITRPVLLLSAGALAAAGGLLTVRDDGDSGDAAGRTAVAAPDGAALFKAKGCATCHDGPDGASMVGVGPSLADVASWAEDRIAGTSGEEYVRQSIVAPQSFTSPAAVDAQIVMPVPPIGPDELDALVAYLLTDRAG